jgi:fibronectin-binding autotransporter adhesin
MLKVISGSYPNGYFIQAQYDMLEVTAGTTVGTNGIRAGNYGQSYTSISNAGTVNGSGILFECAGTVSNTGVIVGAYGIYNVLPTSVYNDGTIGSYSGAKTLALSGGADIVNGGYGHKNAVINGFVGISGAAGTLANFAIINGEISLNDGGAITNGAVGDQTALIDAATGIDIKGAAGTVANFGRITGYGNFRNFGVYMEAGGSVTNGAATDIGALIEAYAGVGIFGGPGSVSNLGAIISVAVGPDGYGVQMNGGGVVTNGATTDRTALISGYTGLEIQGGAGTVANFGTIIGVGVGATEAGLVLEAGGKVTNGGGHDTTALIQGATGVALDGGGTLTNFGTVNGQAASGVYLAVGGVMTNGNGADRVALITGYQGVVSAGAATVTNQGVIWGTGPGYGVSLGGGGRLTNGAVNNAGALILGYSGVLLTKGAVATNFGTIAGEGATSGYGALLSSGASLTNGAAGHTGALVEGAYGVEASSAGVTVTNFGTLSGASGVAVKFEVAGDTLAVEAGSVLVGAASGGGGTLDLASGTGTLTGLLSTGGDVKVSGAIATTTFQDFGKVDVDSDASFTLAGNGAVAAGQGLIVAGTLTAAGTISMAGSLTTTGTLAGTGTLALTGGKSAFNAGTSLTIAKITEAGATTTVTVATNLAYAGVFTQSAGTVSVSSGDKLSLTGTGDSFLGTLAGAGTVAFTGGTDALTGTTLKANQRLRSARRRSPYPARSPTPAPFR